MITPALADIHRICHGSYWRGLADGGSLTTGHHRHWVMLSYDEALELATTGAYSLPQSVIPESVHVWRKLTAGADIIAKSGTLTTLDEYGNIVDEIGKVAIGHA